MTSDEKDIDKLKNILLDIYTESNTEFPLSSGLETYNIEEPYTYIESICVCLVFLHNDNEEGLESIRDCKFKSQEHKNAFTHVGTQYTKSTYRRISYSNSNFDIDSVIQRFTNYHP